MVGHADLALDRSAWVRRLVGRLGEVRVHDTAQAGELARRLGARAFTVGRDVYVRPELMRPASARSMSLLAHELYHVGEQTGVAPTIDMPLLRASSGARSRSMGASGISGASRGRGLAVQRTPGPNAPAPASLSGSEVAAEAIEQAMVRQRVGATAENQAGKEPPDPEDIADAVYGLIVRDLVLDRERAAYGW